MKSNQPNTLTGFSARPLHKEAINEKTPSSLSSTASAAIGERIVANELTFRGFLAVNVNSGEENSPNLDLIALKGGQRSAIQVKASHASSHKGQYRLGYYRETGDYFNTKTGPKADVVIAVYFYSPSEYTCLILPVKDAEQVCRQQGAHWMNTAKKDGQKRSTKFPIYVHPDRSGDYGLDIQPFIEAWHLIT